MAVLRFIGIALDNPIHSARIRTSKFSSGLWRICRRRFNVLPQATNLLATSQNGSKTIITFVIFRAIKGLGCLFKAIWMKLSPPVILRVLLLRRLSVITIVIICRVILLSTFWYLMNFVTQDENAGYYQDRLAFLYVVCSGEACFRSAKRYW